MMSEIPFKKALNTHNIETILVAEKNESKLDDTVNGTIQEGKKRGKKEKGGGEEVSPEYYPGATLPTPQG